MLSGVFHPKNRLVPVIDARLQKTNHFLHYKNSYDALLIGSSRVEQFRQKDFKPLNIFNYGLPSIYPDEYVNYIKFFLENNKQTSPIIFLGFDFYGSNGKNYDHAKASEYYFERCTSLVNFPKILFSLDTLNYARKMSKTQKDVFIYDRLSLDKISSHLEAKTSASLLEKQLENYSTTFYGNYEYNKNYKEILQSIKAQTSGCKLIVFTTPETNDLFRVLLQKGLFIQYENWLKDLVTVFGGVYNFMQPSNFAGNHDNFIDAHHLYPEKTEAITHLITGNGTDNVEFTDYYLTNKNITQRLVKIKANSEKF